MWSLEYVINCLSYESVCVTTCFCGKKVRTRRREKQNGHGKCLVPASIDPQERTSTVQQSWCQQNDPGHHPSEGSKTHHARVQR